MGTETLRSLKPKVILKRGDSYNRTIKVLEKGELQDWTGGKIYFTVREDYPDYDTETDNTSAKIFKEIEGTATGEHTLEVTSEETKITPKDYIFEIRAIDSDGNVHSSITGDFTIESNLTILEES